MTESKTSSRNRSAESSLAWAITRLLKWFFALHQNFSIPIKNQCLARNSSERTQNLLKTSPKLRARLAVISTSSSTRIKYTKISVLHVTISEGVVFKTKISNVPDGSFRLVLLTCGFIFVHIARRPSSMFIPGGNN